MLSKVRAILQYDSHPLHSALVEQRRTFSQRLIAPKCTTERRRKSFLPEAIKLYNSSLCWSDFLYLKKQKTKQNRNLRYNYFTVQSIYISYLTVYCIYFQTVYYLIFHFIVYYIMLFYFIIVF